MAKKKRKATVNHKGNIANIVKNFNVDAGSVVIIDNEGIYKSEDTFFSTKGSFNNNYPPKIIEAPRAIEDIETESEVVSPMLTEKPAKGLGDKVEAVFKATGIAAVVKAVTPKGKDCGCEGRKEILNKMFPDNPPNCMNDEQYKAWGEASQVIKDRAIISKEHQALIIELTKSILNMSISSDSCKSCGASVWMRYIKKLDKVYAEHNTTK